ncbi:hypothetical protein GA0070613_1816 [Micromonospora inositola]|uniref:MYXO-CTERM domain-containing protein n=2 Tax=Micromonospora inositola TaxID=47865 RepID=A0A1C5HU56_9ACTN|nr:hypothetical protein GA0070613_1816 [Micromonospora inositola]
MVNLPAARRHHRSRVGYAFGLLALLGAATALAVAVNHPALSSTQQLAEPVPAPEITVAGEGSAPPDEPDEPGWAGGVGDAPGAQPRATPDRAGGGAGEGAVAEGPAGPAGVRTAAAAADLSRSLFYSGLLGLAISLAGLGLVGTRRRQW